jgi:hypothetical protein
MMAEECDARISDYHSSNVDTRTDVETVARAMIRDKTAVQNLKRKRVHEESVVQDLFIRGQNKIATTEKIMQYKRSVISSGLTGNEQIGDEVEITQNYSETTDEANELMIEC